MRNLSDNFVNIPQDDDETSKNAENQDGETANDPLDGVEAEVEEPKVCRINSFVFAEPLNLTVKKSNSELRSSTKIQQNEIMLIDNVIVQKRVGRRNKYHIDVNNAINPTCPQPHCKKTFSSPKLLKDHVRKVHCHERNRYICEECHTGFAAQYLLRRHMAIHERRKVECPVCHKLLSERTNLTLHMRSHTDSRIHECPECHKRFVRKATLTIHMRFVHRDGDLKCDKCDARFVSRSQWSRHRSSHSKLLPCARCGRLYPRTAPHRH